MSHLRVKNVGMAFGAHPLFSGVSFDLTDGELLVVTGSNGSGKTTLLHIVAGLLTPTEGTVNLHRTNAAMADENRPRLVGLVGAYLSLYGAFTARENLSFQHRARGGTGTDSRISSVLDRVGLGDRADEPVDTFSSGMLQRLRIASAILPEPPLFLLDEPFTNLDQPGRSLVRDLITEQRERGRMIMLATNRGAVAEGFERTLSVEDFPGS